MNLLKKIGYRIMRVLPGAQSAAVILMYHSVSSARHYSAVAPEHFADHMKALAENGFNVVSLDQLAEMRAHDHIPPKTVCITFDDGYRDNFTEAFPILQTYRFPAAIFVITDVIGKQWELRGESFDMLSEAEIRTMHDSGLVTIAPHTASHQKLDLLSHEEVERELNTSKERIETLVGETCVHLAYPFGRSSMNVRHIAKQVGFQSAYTVVPGRVRPKDEAFALKRNAVDRTTSISELLEIAHVGRVTKQRALSWLHTRRSVEE